MLMASLYKTSTFENTIKKYTLCSQCDGKIAKNSFFLCGCNEILCSYCQEKHSCRFSYKTVKYESIKDSKSINFIHNLVETVNQQKHEKERDKITKQVVENISKKIDNSNFHLPDLDRFMENERPDDVSCATSIFEDIHATCSRNHYFQNYNIKSNLDGFTENERSEDISFSSLFDNIDANCSTIATPNDTKMKSISPRINYSIKRTQFLSDSDNDEFEKSLSKQSIDHSLKRKTKRRKLSTRGKESNVISLGDRVTYLPSEHASLGEGSAETSSLTKHLLPVEEQTNCVNNGVAKFSYSRKKSITSKMVTDEDAMKNHDRNTENANVEDSDKFDGFDQCEINASSLNCMLNLLQHSDIVREEMKFPMTYKGKTIFIHIGRNINTPIDEDNAEHYILKKHVGVKNSHTQIKVNCENNYTQTASTSKDDYTQTEDMTAIKEYLESSNGTKNQQLQTDSCLVKEQAVGPDPKKPAVVQTDSYQLIDACNGPEMKKTAVQSDSYQVIDVCVGTNYGVPAAVQTYGYQVADAYVGADKKIPKFVQTDSYQVQSSCTSPEKCTTTAVQSDPFDGTPIPSFDMSMLTGFGDESPQLVGNEYSLGTSSDALGGSDEEDIIEGTPVKTNNVSICSSLDLSSIKDSLSFDLMGNGSRISRNEVISCSNLTNIEKSHVLKFAQEYKMVYSEYFTDKTTHLVVSCDIRKYRTYKCLLAIASKAYVVSFSWVMESLQAEAVLPEKDYIPTFYPGPLRCRLTIRPPFLGFSICSQLVTKYPGVEAMKALCKLSGAFIMENVQSSVPKEWPFPRFVLFEEESHLTCQILNNCSRNHVVAVNLLWAIDSIACYSRLPISNHLSSTFILTDDIIEAYRIPSDLIVD